MFFLMHYPAMIRHTDTEWRKIDGNYALEQHILVSHFPKTTSVTTTSFRLKKGTSFPSPSAARITYDRDDNDNEMNENE